MSKPVYVITEQRNGAFRKVSFEVVSEARRLADELGTSVVAILLGSGVSGIGEELGQYGADKVLVADNEIFENYSAEGYTKTILETIKKRTNVITLPKTIRTKAYKTIDAMMKQS